MAYPRYKRPDGLDQAYEVIDRESKPFTMPGEEGPSLVGPGVVVAMMIGIAIGLMWSVGWIHF